MTWFGTVSAWAALLMGAMFAVNAYFQFATGIGGWVNAVTALLLLAGGFRTLRKMRGGLRLLAGAWGIAAGLLALPLTVARETPLSIAELGLLAIALIGVALTVTHKESKKA
jgi:hypothetical protein